MLGCGYQLGWASFAGQLLVGFLGAPPVRYDKAFAKKLGVDKTYIERFLDWDENVKKMMEIPHTCTTQELLIHCVAAKRIIDIYRATAAPVVGLWELFQQLIPRSLADGEEYVHKCLIFRKEEIVLPNGMSMKYPNLRQQKNPDTKKMEWVYGDDATRLYAGKIANNCLAEGTEVLTGRGWVCIESVSDYDVVYDGVEFVQHAGRVCNGVQPCITLDGVLLTEDHFVLGARTLVVARELTKLFETIESLPLLDAPEWLKADPNRMRGEFVLIVSGASASWDDGEAERVLSLLLEEGLSTKQAAKLAAQITGAAKNTLYERALQLKKDA